MFRNVKVEEYEAFGTFSEPLGLKQTLNKKIMNLCCVTVVFRYFKQMF